MNLETIPHQIYIYFHSVNWHVFGGAFTILASWFAAAFAASRALKNFFQQKKVERMHRMYYEQSILEPINRLNQSFSLVKQNIHILNSMNAYLLQKFGLLEHISKPQEISNDLKNLNKFLEILNLDYIKEIIARIKFPDLKGANYPIGDIFDQVRLGFGKIFLRWFEKIEDDFFEFSCILRNLMANWQDVFSDQDKKILFNKESMEDNVQIVNRCISVIKSHIFLLKIASKIKTNLAVKDYKSEFCLIKELSKDVKFLDLLCQFDESFKILFGYYKSGESYITYANEEDGSRYQIFFNGPSIKLDKNSNLSFEKKLEFFSSSQEFQVASNMEDSEIKLHEKLIILAKAKNEEMRSGDQRIRKFKFFRWFFN